MHTCIGNCHRFQCSTETISYCNFGYRPIRSLHVYTTCICISLHVKCAMSVTELLLSQNMAIDCDRMDTDIAGLTVWLRFRACSCCVRSIIPIHKY